MTTIKVPKPLRQRLADDAREQGMTIAQLLQSLLAEHERGQRFAAVARAYESVGTDYAAESAEWEAAEVQWPR